MGTAWFNEDPNIRTEFKDLKIQRPHVIELKGLEKFVITVVELSEVNGTKIDVVNSNFIAYKLSFSIEMPDGTIKELFPEKSIIMYENKAYDKSLNTLGYKRDSYPLEWKTMKNNEERHSSKWTIKIRGSISNNGKKEAAIYMHTTEAAYQNEGCKGVCYEEDAVIDYGDATNAANGKEGEALYTIYAGRNWNEDEDPGEAFNECTTNSRNALLNIRKLYDDNAKDNKNYLGGFELKIEHKTSNSKTWEE